MGDAMAKEERICKFIKDELSGANLELMRQVVGGLKLKLGSLLEKSPAPADESDDARKLSEINKVLADEDNDNLIFKPVWLKKGIAAMISAPSGVGKSTLSMQLAYSWALGRGMFGLNPVRPLRIGVLESEDDEDEMLMFRDSMKRGYMKFCGWTEEEVKAAENRIYSIPTKGKTGKEFVDLLKRAQLKAIKRDNAPYDLIIINPLMGFTGFDLSDNSKMLAFTRDWLDPVIKGMDPELPVRTALLIINHLTKVNIFSPSDETCSQSIQEVSLSWAYRLLFPPLDCKISSPARIIGVPAEQSRDVIIALALSIRFFKIVGFVVGPSSPPFQDELLSVPSKLFSPLASLCF